MQTLLVVLCMLMLLFTGGCAVVAFGIGIWPLAAIMGGIAALNAIVIMAVRGTRAPERLVFTGLAVLDLLIGGMMLSGLLSDPDWLVGKLTDPQDGFVLGVMAVTIGLLTKGVLTLLVGRRLRVREAAGETQAATPRHAGGEAEGEANDRGALGRRGPQRRSAGPRSGDV